MALPAFVKNKYLSGKNPGDMDDATALANGNFLYEYLKHYLRNDFSHTYIQPSFTPTDRIDPKKQAAILAYFSPDDKKRWLGRQLYLCTGFPGHKTGGHDSGDDTPYLLNWLFNRSAPVDMGVMSGPSPLQAGLKQGGGGNLSERAMAMSPLENQSAVGGFGGGGFGGHGRSAAALGRRRAASLTEEEQLELATAMSLSMKNHRKAGGDRRKRRTYRNNRRSPSRKSRKK